MRLKVTVHTPASAKACYGHDNPAYPYAVAAPDGLFYGPTWEWACTVAHAYITAGIVQDVSYL